MQFGQGWYTSRYKETITVDQYTLIKYRKAKSSTQDPKAGGARLVCIGRM